ncbi:ABC transporter ATP-binding protein [Brevibacillus ginsengisoli]|uniref:ABC transporter ATP-binding protein n=1 Tax=Brevibacillus ginsengisoli TaxID=363854 RepID=UPI003CF60F88
MAQLIVENVGKQYLGQSWALREITIQIEEGITGLLGPNGAGKSSLMRILATLTRPSEGKVSWNSQDITQFPNTIRSQLGYLPQDFGVYPNLNAIEFLQYIAALKGMDRKAAKKRIEELLQLLNLTEVCKRPLGGYSGGMKQRVGIAQSLLNDPKCLILDEPTVGLDPEERVHFRNLLSSISKGRIVILSTHIVSDIEAVADRIAIMAKGKLLTHTTPDALLQAAEGHVWECSVKEEQFHLFQNMFQISHSVRKNDGLLVRIVSEVPPDHTAWRVIPTLEDAYLFRTAALKKGVTA